MTIRWLATALLCSCLASPAFAQGSNKPQRAAGRVDAVRPDSVTILLPGDNALTVLVDKTTKLTGRGLAARSRPATRDGPLDGLLEPSDTVVITYTDAGGGKLHATEIHVRVVSK